MLNCSPHQHWLLPADRRGVEAQDPASLFGQEMFLEFPCSKRALPAPVYSGPCCRMPSAFQAKAVSQGAGLILLGGLASFRSQSYSHRRRQQKTLRSAQAVGGAPLPKLTARLRIEGNSFVDDQGRIAVPRGINFSGLSKVPVVPDGATHIAGRCFYSHREVSFVGRPCPLEDLEGHLQRLREWGFNLLRLLVTWEAVEHAGPGVYDEEYLDFIRTVCLRAGDFGFWVVIDPHQDCWSRWTGGDGAPGWTLEASRLKTR